MLSMIRYEIETESLESAEILMEYFASQRGTVKMVQNTLIHGDGFDKKKHIGITVMIEMNAHALYQCKCFAEYTQVLNKYVSDFAEKLEEIMAKEDLPISGEFSYYVAEYDVASSRRGRG